MSELGTLAVIRSWKKPGGTGTGHTAAGGGAGAARLGDGRVPVTRCTISQTPHKIRWTRPTDLSDPPGCTKSGPGRLAQKMSVMSVEPPARGAPGLIAA